MNAHLINPKGFFLRIFLAATAILMASLCSSQAARDAAAITEVVESPSAEVAQRRGGGGQVRGAFASRRAITNIVGDLYSAQNNFHNTVFLVTEDGIILGDPINLEFAHWLKDELKQRFDKEVKYVLYSHNHFDHAAGGAAFADTAEFIGHENMAATMLAPLPDNQTDLDGDNKISRDEAGRAAALTFTLLDRNGDGYLTGAEFYADVVPPTITFTDTYPVYLGGREVKMVYAGKNHSNDASVLMFPEEGAVFGVDWLSVNNMPGGFRGNSLDDWLASVDTVIDLNPSRILPGHGDIGDRDNLLEYRQYFVDLKTAAEKAVAANQTREAFLESIEMPAYSHWARYDEQLKPNAAEAYDDAYGMVE